MDIVLDSGGDPLRRLWDSFGAGIEAAANSHPNQWQQSMARHLPTMRQSREVKTLQAAFALDIRDTAWAYLRENDKIVKAEMVRLGIPENEKESLVPSAAQADALAKAKAAAEEVAKAQETREQLRMTEVAYHIKNVARGEKELPAGGVDDLERLYEPVLFDPDSRFAAEDQPTDYVVGLRTWDDTHRQHTQLTKTIEAYFVAHPALYALSRSDNSGAAARGLAKADPAQARAQLAKKLYEVRQNITDSRDKVPAIALQMTPIQQQLLAGQVGAAAALKRDWSKGAFLHSLGEDVVSQQQPGPWWQTLGMASLEAAAFVVVGIATGGIGPLLLAGAQTAISIGKYQTLEAASRSNVTKDTVLVKDGEVQAAAAEAVISAAMTFIAAVTAARGLFAARIASAAGKELAKELGEDVARRLLMQITPEAAQALKNKLGAEALKDLAFRLGGTSLDRLAQELTAAEIRGLLDGVGWEVVERLSKDVGGKGLQGLMTDLGAGALKNLGSELGVAEIQAMITKHGPAGVKWLATDLGGAAAKQLGDQLAVDAVKALSDISAKEAAEAVNKLGVGLVNDFASPLKGKGIQDLAALNMFTFDPAKQTLLKGGQGSAVRGLGAIDGATLPVIENKLTGSGFTKTAAKGGQDIWTHPDGSVVRIKTGPQALQGQRTTPHLVREVSKKPGAFGTKDIFAKVAQDGTVIPQGTSFAEESLRQWFNKVAGRAPSANELDRLMKVWGDAGHADVVL